MMPRIGNIYYLFIIWSPDWAATRSQTPINNSILRNASQALETEPKTEKETEQSQTREFMTVSLCDLCNNQW